MNEERVATYRRVMEAEQQLYALLQQRGMTGAELEAMFEVMQAAGAAAERDDDPYLSIVSAYVSALGGQLEVRAVFPDGDITLRRDAEV